MKTVHRINILTYYRQSSSEPYPSRSSVLEAFETALLQYFKRLISFTNFNAEFLYSLKYVCYITILDMFRALTCPASGGQIVLSQHLVSSLSVNGCTVCRMRADVM